MGERPQSAKGDVRPLHSDYGEDPIISCLFASQNHGNSRDFCLKEYNYHY